MPDATATRAVEVLHRMLAGTLPPTDTEAAIRVQGLLAAALSETGRAAAFARYLGEPGSEAARHALITEVALRMRTDPTFRAAIAGSLPGTPATGITAGRDISAGGRGIVAGRDVTGSNNVDRSRRTHFGGILVAAVAVVALFLVGRAVVVTLAGEEEAGLTGSSTCREFLAAGPQVQLEALKKVYLDAGRADLAGDVFILQNGQYMCGQAPSRTLDSLAR
ncbi:MAG TPA: hypothetical protein VGD67_23320 [Pseudonocardiaceae bacterium]